LGYAGLSYGIAALAYIYSAKANGVTMAFIYSQLCVIISTLGGMTLLGEHKHGKELAATLLDLALIVIGAIIS
jgi:glucose uptake protein